MDCKDNPLNTFENLGLSTPILKAISAEGYTEPTPIQAKAIPVLCDGRDLVGIAQTGTGKTASFVLPLLHKIIEDRPKRAPKTCGALILSPTRELAAQIIDNIRTYSRFSNVSVVLVVGGVRPGIQIKKLRAGVDIVVATPGRLVDHIGSGGIVLNKTQTVIIDEADQMLDLGFVADIRKIMARVPKGRQTALLSATMPKQIRQLADDFLVRPKEIKVAAASQPVERIAQSVRHVEKDEKRHVLTKILSDKSVQRTVVFTRTKRGADRVCKHLVAADLAATAIHGDKSQGQRDRAMAAFRSGKISILVATDIAARGIDIDDITHVVNFELPNVPEAYVHRIGRTARAGRSGTAISLCDPSERKLLRDIEKLIGKRVDCEGDDGRKSRPRRPHKPRDKSSRTDTQKTFSKKSRKKPTSSDKAKRPTQKPRKPRNNGKSAAEQHSGRQVRKFRNTNQTNTKSAA